jgi:mono/diheme cytochrome c family protein
MKQILGILVLCAGLGACDQNMEDQPKYDQYEPAPLFRNGRVLQSPVAGTVARGDLARDAERTARPPLSMALLARGQTQHDVFCALCHARTGDGGGMIVQRGFPRPPSYHSDRLRNESDQHLFDVITNGYGAMYSYAARVRPRDRWAIIAYIRALQISQNARIKDVPENELRSLLAETRE